MSREIKFRAWSKKHNRYLKITGVQYVGDKIAGVCVIYGILAGIPNVIFLEPEDVVLEQSTGLKDKNGKEIYEGDIVALLFGYVPMKSVTTENIRIENAQKAVIHFDTARAAFRYTMKLRTPKDCQFKPGTETNMVVVGNVHEDGDLLGGTK